jgi:hypothetical protein
MQQRQATLSQHQLSGIPTFCLSSPYKK